MSVAWLLPNVLRAMSQRTVLRLWSNSVGVMLEAYAELRSAENIVRRVLEEVQSPKWHFVDPEED